MQSLWSLDQELFRAVHVGWQRDWLDPVFWLITSTGLGWVQILLILGSFIAAKKGQLGWAKRHLRQNAIPLIAAWGLAGLLNTAWLKQAVERDRPSVLAIAQPQEDVFKSAFPSGHTATSFALATLIALMCVRSQRRLEAFLAVLWASLVGLSRIYRGVHWPTDVLGAAAVGVFSGCLVWLTLSAMNKSGPERNSKPLSPDPDQT